MRNKHKHKISHGIARNCTELHGIARNKNTSFRAGSVSDGCTHPIGVKSKGSNGVVAVGLPHRNYSI